LADLTVTFDSEQSTAAYGGQETNSFDPSKTTITELRSITKGPGTAMKTSDRTTVISLFLTETVNPFEEPAIVRESLKLESSVPFEHSTMVPSTSTEARPISQTTPAITEEMLQKTAKNRPSVKVPEEEGIGNLAAAPVRSESIHSAIVPQFLKLSPQSISIPLNPTIEAHS
jgi:hypothetical protein